MKSNDTRSTNKGAIENGTRNKFRIPKNVPSHVIELSMIIHFNHGIRRHTALNILNYFIQKGIIDSQSDKDRYVDFISADNSYWKINYPYLFRLKLDDTKEINLENAKNVLKNWQ